MDANLYEMTCAQCASENCSGCKACVTHVNRNINDHEEREVQIWG